MSDDGGRIWQDIDKAYRGHPPADVLAHGWLTDAEVLVAIGGERIWWCADWKVSIKYTTGGYQPQSLDVGTLRLPCTEDDPHRGGKCGWQWLVKE